MKLTALILDDERRGRELLQQLLAIHCPEIHNILLAASLDEAITLLNTYKPDILFLDIRLGNDFGLDIIPFLSQPMPYIIVTTAHPEFAIKALRVKVLDYLLKPIIADELIAAVNKARHQSLNEKNPDAPFAANKPFDPNKKITLPTTEGLIFILLKDIIYCKAEGAYTYLYLKDNAQLVVSINLGEMEKLLAESWGFFRVHHAYLINVHEIIKYMKIEGGYVVMSDQSQIAISQRRKTLFLQFIKQLD